MTDAAHRRENKLAVALAAREAMREHRKGKPIAFDWNWRPVVTHVRTLTDLSKREGEMGRVRSILSVKVRRG